MYHHHSTCRQQVRDWLSHPIFVLEGQQLERIARVSAWGSLFVLPLYGICICMLTSVLFPELSLSHTVSQFWPDETWFDGGSKIRSEKIQAHNSILRNQCEQCERRPHGDPSVNNTYSVKEYDNVQSVKDTTMYKVAKYDNVQSFKTTTMYKVAKTR